MKSIFSNYNGMKLQVNNTKKTRTFRNMWKLHNTLLKTQMVKEEIMKDIRKERQMKMKAQHIKTYRMQ